MHCIQLFSTNWRSSIPQGAWLNVLMQYPYIYTGCPRKSGTVDFQYLAS